MVLAKWTLLYEPVKVFTLIWWPQRCKKSSLMIWILWYPKPRFNKIVLILALRWCKLFVMVACNFVMAKNGLVSRNGGKGFFAAAVKLNIQTSENIFSHSLWSIGWMSGCSVMLGPSGLQKKIYILASKKMGSSFGYQCSFCSNSIFSGIFMKTIFLDMWPF